MKSDRPEPAQSLKSLHGKKNLHSIKRYALVLIVAWTLLILGVVLWNARQEMQYQQEYVRVEARAHFLKDQAFRFWATLHGGVYIPPTEHTPPNPYLSHIPDRDIEAKSGKKLTLMNPAYMVRQLMEDFGDMYGIKGHITSLNPLRPGNAPDQWERRALESFEKGTTETDEFTEIDGKPYLRLMRPMITKPGCLKCHAHQGYKEGDIRGGVGVSVPADRFFAQGRKEIQRNLFVMIFIWLTGFSGLVIGYNRIKRRIRAQHRAEEEKLAMEQQVLYSQKLESLGVLAGGIAHDFNNLLTIIIGNAEMASQVLSPTSPSQGNLEEIKSASTRAADLARQMLTYSGKGLREAEPVDTEKLIEEMTNLIVASIPEPDTFKYEPSGNLPVFEGDAAQIRQVVLNLIINASEAIGDRDGQIQLTTGPMYCGRQYLDNVDKALQTRLEQPLPEGDYVFIQVKDTGRGMDAGTLEKIFDPFFTTKFTGRGLGMSATLGIVHSHRGGIVIDSQIDKGTTIRVFFPAVEDAIEDNKNF